MKTKLVVIAAVAAVALLALGSAIAWAAISGGGSGPMMYRSGAAQAQGPADDNYKQMYDACLQVMKDGGMMDADDMQEHMGSGQGHMGSGQGQGHMGQGQGHMGGGGMMGRGTNGNGMMGSGTNGNGMMGSGMMGR